MSVIKRGEIDLYTVAERAVAGLDYHACNYIGNIQYNVAFSKNPARHAPDRRAAQCQPLMGRREFGSRDEKGTSRNANTGQDKAYRIETLIGCVCVCKDEKERTKEKWNGERTRKRALRKLKGGMAVLLCLKRQFAGLRYGLYITAQLVPVVGDSWLAIAPLCFSLDQRGENRDPPWALPALHHRPP